MLNFAFAYEGEESMKIGWDRLIREACDMYGFRSSVEQIEQYLDDRLDKTVNLACELLDVICPRQNRQIWQLCFANENTRFSKAEKKKIIGFITKKILRKDPPKPIYGAAWSSFTKKQIADWRQAVRAFEFHAANLRNKTCTPSRSYIIKCRKDYAYECGVDFDCRTHRDVPGRNMIERRAA